MRLVYGSPAIAAFQKLPPGSAMQVAPSDVVGLIPYLFSIVCSAELGRNCTVEYWWPKLPANMTTDDTGLNAVYLLNDLKMDVVGNLITITGPRRQYMRFSTTYQTYQYQVFAPRAVLLKKTLSEKLWTWASPFDGTLWAALIGSVLFSGVRPRASPSHMSASTPRAQPPRAEVCDVTSSA